MNHLYEQLTELKLTGFRDALKNQIAQPGAYLELGFEERLSLLGESKMRIAIQDLVDSRREFTAAPDADNCFFKMKPIAEIYEGS